jgi:hypothetical protein
MIHRLSRISVGQTAKVAGLLYGLMGIILLPLFMIPAFVGADGAGFPAAFALVLPILYGVFGYIFTAIGCALYNWVAGRVGGIELNLDTEVRTA